MAPILINGNLVDLDSGHPKNQVFGEDAQGSDYILIQTEQPLSKAELGLISDAGAVLQESVAPNTYLFHYVDTDLTAIRGLTFVTKAGIYSKGLKVENTLQECTRMDPSAMKDVYVVLHEDKNHITPLQAAHRLAGTIGVPLEDVSVDGNRVKMHVRLDQLKALSTVDAVRTIEEVPSNVVANNIARQILYADIVINKTPYRGAGQVVAVADTGFDKGSTTDTHPAFKGRIKALLPIGRSDLTNDPVGHGTHVCGSIAGGRADGSIDESMEGIAPEVQLVVQSLQNNDGGLFPSSGFNLKDMLVKPHKEHGAYIHSNSWGSKWTGQQLPYNEESRLIDTAIWENPELLVVFAAGNDGGVWPWATLGSQAAAKNCLTVGATESWRPSVSGVFQPKKLSKNDTTEISWYSNRGPTKEGRIKPDVVAPGTAILSARSRDAPESAKFGVSDDPLWSYNTGTSMATPLVSGCAAILREALVKNGVEKPSAALLKALIINGAYAYHHAHSGKEGFGRVNLENSVIIPGKTEKAGFMTGQPLKDRGQVLTTEIDIVTPSSVTNGHDSTLTPNTVRVGPPAGTGVTLKVTMAYTDMPSATIQNDINLNVVCADGTQRNGNMGSFTGAYDSKNNVQQIIWKGIPAGKTKINVVAGQILSNEQDFAMVWRILDTEE